MALIDRRPSRQGNRPLGPRRFGGPRAWPEVWLAIVAILVAYVLAITGLVEIPMLSIRVAFVALGPLLLRRMRRGLSSRQLHALDDDLRRSSNISIVVGLVVFTVVLIIVLV